MLASETDRNLASSKPFQMADELTIKAVVPRIDRILLKISSSLRTLGGKHPESGALCGLRDELDHLEAAIKSAGQVCEDSPGLDYLPKNGLASALETTYEQLRAQSRPSFKKIYQDWSQRVLPSTFQTKELDDIAQCAAQSTRLVSFHVQIILAFSSVQAGARPLSHDQFILDEAQEHIFAQLRNHQNTALETRIDAAHPLCLPGTQIRSLEQIYSWICSSNTHSIYWHAEIAGSEKSAVARTIAHVLHRRKQFGGSFFFDKTKRESRSIQSLCFSLTAQLALYQPATASHICQVLSDDPEIFSRSLSVQFSKLITGSVSTAIGQPDNTTPIFIIIDSLDQLSKGDAIRLLNLLSRSVCHCLGLKFILIGIPITQESLNFKVKHGMVCKSTSDEESNTSQKDDVGLFLNYLFRTMGRQYRESFANGQEIPTDWPGDVSMGLLKDIAATNYNVATILVRHIWGEGLSSPMDRLQRVLSVYRMQPQSQPLPRLRSILNSSANGRLNVQSEVSAEARRSLLGSIAILQDPIPAKAFASLLALPDPVLLESLSGYQTACGAETSPSSVVAFVPEVYEIFSSSNSDESSSDLANLRVWQGQMFTNCLRVLSRSTGSEPGANTPGVSLQESRFVLQRETNHTDVSYASMYWGHHLEESESILIHEDKVDEFLKSHLFEWAAELCLMALPFESLEILMSLRRAIPSNIGHQIKSSLEKAIHALVPWLDKAQSLTQEEDLKALIRVQQQGLGGNPSFRNISEDLPIVSELRLMNAGKNIRAVAVSPDSKMVACTADKNIQLWSIPTGALMQTLKGHRRSTMCLAFSSDGRLASGSFDFTVKIWQLDVGIVERTLRGHTDIVGLVTYSSGCNLIASASVDKTVNLWSVDQGTLLHTFEHSSFVYALSFTLDSKYLVSGSADHDGRMWDVLSGNLATALKGHNGGILSIAINKSMSLIASGSEDTTLRLWSFAGDHLASVTSHNSPVIFVEFLSEGTRLVSVSEDGTIQIHSTTTMEVMFTNHGHENAVNSISLIPDGGFMASGSRDKTLKLWMIANESHQGAHQNNRPLRGPRQRIRDLAEIRSQETRVIEDWSKIVESTRSPGQQDDTSSSSSESSLDLVELSEMSFGQRKAFLASKRRRFGHLDMADLDPRSKIGSAMLLVDHKAGKDGLTLITDIWSRMFSSGRMPEGRRGSEIRNKFDLWFLWLDCLKNPDYRTQVYPTGSKEVKVADLLLEWWHYEESVHTNIMMDFFKRNTADGSGVAPILPTASYRAIMFGLWQQEMTAANELGSLIDLATLRQHAAWISAAHRLAMATLPTSESTGLFRVKDRWVPVSLDPCPWLQQWWVGARSSAHFLWDTQTRMTVENNSNSLDYIVVSHTWGRWRIEGRGANVEGVPWPVPRNSLFDVTRLPEILSQFPFDTRYIWFDLVCIPQDESPLQQQEISKQADIFQNAKRAVIWFNRIDTWEGTRAAINWLCREYLLTCPESSSARHPFADFDLDLLADRTTGLANMVHTETDPFGYNFMHHGNLRKVTPDPWFTSLWTLQEVCLRPDMYLCNSKMEVLTTNSPSPRAIPMDHIISLFNSLQGGAIMRKSLPLGIHELAGVMALTSVSQVLDMSPIALLGHGSQRHYCRDTNRALAIMSALGTTEWHRAYQKRSLQGSAPGLEMIHEKYPLQFVREAFACFGATFFTSRQHGSSKFMASSQAYSYALGWRKITDIKFGATMMPFTPDNMDRSSIVVLPHLTVGVTEHQTVKHWTIDLDGSVHMRKAGVIAACPHDANRKEVMADVWAWIPTSKVGGPPRKISEKNVDLHEWLASFRPGAEKYAIWLFQAGQYSTGILLERVYRSSDSREFFKFGTFSIPRTTESHQPRLERVNLRVI